MPTPGQISKENLKQILVFFPAVVYNICVVLFSFQLNYTTQKRICPACGLQILFCLLRAFFHSPPSCHPYQFLLKSFRFPGAKTARKRFLLWKMGFSAAKILPCPPYMPLGTIEIREGFGPLELSEGFSTVCAFPGGEGWAHGDCDFVPERLFTMRDNIANFFPELRQGRFSARIARSIC